MTLTSEDLPKRNETLREQLIERLRQGVLSGRLEPGERLVENRIAATLGVSRGPVREAIFQLVEEGLAEQTPYRGTVVRTLSVKDLEEIYSFRTLLERFAFSQAWERRNESFAASLDERHRALQQAIRRQDKQQAIRCEMDLHAVAYEFAEHRILLDSWNMLRQRVHVYFSLHQAAHGRSGPLPDAHDEYVALAKGASLPAMLHEIEAHMRRGLDQVGSFVREWDGGRNA